MSRIRLILAIGLIALILPAIGCGSRTRCCPSKPNDCSPPCGGNPNVPPPPPGPQGAGF